MYSYICDCTSYDDKITCLSAYTLNACHRQLGKPLDEFLQRLKQLSVDCNATALTVIENKEAFIEWVRSSYIKERFATSTSWSLVWINLGEMLLKHPVAIYKREYHGWQSCVILRMKLSQGVDSNVWQWNREIVSFAVKADIHAKFFRPRTGRVTKIYVGKWQKGYFAKTYQSTRTKLRRTTTAVLLAFRQTCIENFAKSAYVKIEASREEVDLAVKGDSVTTTGHRVMLCNSRT